MSREARGGRVGVFGGGLAGSCAALAPARHGFDIDLLAALTIALAEPAAAAGVPSITLVSGAYGDVVNHGGGRLFASWYPLCKLAESHGIDGAALHDRARAACPPDLARRSVAALARFVPALDPALAGAASVAIGGGVIVAWGATDIDDPASGLHERHAIGPSLHGDWASMDTGKYCMAPYHALALAERIAGAYD